MEKETNSWMDVDLMQSLFPQLDPLLVREVLQAPQMTENTVLSHLLLLCPDHFLNSLSTALRLESTLILMRGLPGSGKSTLARILAVIMAPNVTEIVSADDFFVDRQGQYTYISSLVAKAHEWCRGRVIRALKDRHVHTVILDNTNIEGWEMAPYCELAQQHRYSVILLEPPTSYKMDPKSLSERTRHGVSMMKISEMRSKMVENFTLQKDVFPLIQPQKRPRINDGSGANANFGVQNGVAVESSIRKEEEKTETRTNGSKGTKSSRNLDFQSLLQCFPDLDASDLYPLFVAADNDVEKTVDLVLKHQAQMNENSNESEEKNSNEEFTLTLDASFATNLELQFGNVKQNVANFPGVYDVKVPRSLAMLMHSLWKETLSKTISEDKEGNKERHRQLLLDRVVVENGRSQSSSPFRPQEAANFVSTISDRSRSSSEVNNKGVVVSQDEIRQLRQRRSELYRKAAEAFKARQGGVAAYYSEEGRELTQRIQFKETLYRHNKFMSKHPDLGQRLQLDLHGLNVEEALEQVDWFLEAKIQQLLANVAATLRVEIVTGRGRGRVLTAVLKHLREEHLLSNLTVAPDNQGPSSSWQSPEITNLGKSTHKSFTSVL